MSALEDIATERRRQIEAEGWSPQHDDEHENGEMACAAAAYALIASGYYDGLSRSVWPWHPGWWKPTHPRRDLVKAAALVLAEIERLDRATEAANDMALRDADFSPI